MTSKLMLVLSAMALTILAVIGTARAEEAKITALFNGKDLSGWTYHLADPKVKMADVWSVKDGILSCTGTPVGYLITKKKNLLTLKPKLKNKKHLFKALNYKKNYMKYMKVYVILKKMKLNSMNIRYQI